MTPPPPLNRVVVKISGEAFQGNLDGGIDIEGLYKIAGALSRAYRNRRQIAVVVGGGNIWRGGKGKGRELERVTSDNIGMLATIMNALALQDALENLNIPTRVMSAIEVAKVAEPYIRRRATRHLEKGRTVIFAAGTGNPFFSTDTAAALRATEIGASLLLKATQVDGVYSDDPKKNPNATKFTKLTFMDAIRRGLAIMDTSALSLCMENKIPVRVFNLHKKGMLEMALAGKNVGTLIVP